MGTPHQATAIVTIVNTIKRNEGKFPLSEAGAAEVRARVLAMTPAEVREQFKLLNAKTGFDRQASPATPGQRKTIAELELAVYGDVHTTWAVKLDYPEASDLIASLIALRDEQRKGVRSLEEHANNKVTDDDALAPVASRTIA